MTTSGAADQDGIIASPIISDGIIALDASLETTAVPSSLLEGSELPETNWEALSRRMRTATDWKELDTLERCSFCFEAIMHFFRGLTIPVIPEDHELSGRFFPSLSAIFKRKMQKLRLFSCILLRNEGKTRPRP